MTHLFILKPKIVLRARVAAAPDYPSQTVFFNSVSIGSGGQAGTGMMLRAGSGPGMDDLGRVRVKRNGEPTAVDVGRFSQGRNDGELDILAGSWIDVLELYGVWAKLPWIDKTQTDPTGYHVSYKDGDIGYLGNASYPTEGSARNPPPITNCGAGRAATIDPITGKITVTLSGHESLQFDPAISTSYSACTNFQWYVVDGTIISGSATSETITVTFPAGFRYVSLACTNSNNGCKSTRRIPILARDPANDLCMAHQVESLRIGTSGQELSVKVLQDLPRIDYPDGTLVMLWDGEPSNASDWTNVLFSGWANRENYSARSERTATTADLSLTCVDTVGRLKQIPGFSQIVEAVTIPPRNWFETQYANFFYYVWYLLFWHSTALEVSDFLPMSQTLTIHKFKRANSDAATLYEQVSAIANNITPDQYLNCTRRGQLLLAADPIIQVLGDRTAVEDESISESQWTEIDVGYERPPRVYQLVSYAIDTDATLVAPDMDEVALACRAPGEAEGQGSQFVETSQRYTTGQFFLNYTEGNRYARLNKPYTSVSVKMPFAFLDKNYEPAYMRWMRLTWDNYNRRGDITARGLCHDISVSYEYDDGGVTALATISWEQETYGPPALTVVVEVEA